MKQKETRSWQYVTVLLGVLLVMAAHQNCARFGQFHSVDLSSSSAPLSLGNRDENHPNAKDLVPPTQKVQVVHRGYVTELMREIFTTAAGPVPNLEKYLFQWIYNRGSQFGLGCNSYDTYSGRDCFLAFTNANLPLRMDDSVVRESFRIQFCEVMLSTTAGVQAILEKIPSRPVAPNAEAVKAVYELFYRGDEANSAIVNSLLEFDRQLAVKGEPPLERWRGLALQVCESSGWQLQ